MGSSTAISSAPSGWPVPAKLTWIKAPSPWQAVLLHLPDLPLKQDLRAGVCEIMEKVIRHQQEAASLQVATWLLLDQLHKDGAVHALSRNGRYWMPDFGLGIWPDRQPPRMYEDRDFLDLEYGAAFPKMMHSVAKAGAAEESALHAWRTMFGTGSTILTLARGPSQQLLEAMHEPLLSLIHDEAFRSFPWYFTLLGRNALSQASGDLLNRWLGPVSFYMRESEEDNSLLLVSCVGLMAALGAAGFSCDSPIACADSPFA
jgi:hypothetical protein